MPPTELRVVFENRPYLVVRRDDGHIEAAYGPFTPGTEPNLADCDPATEVHDGRLLRSLEQLLPVSPELPQHEDTLAGTR